MSAPNRKIRWGVLGYARIARESVIPAILRSSNSSFHAIASRDDARLVDCRTRFPTPKTYRGYDELIRDPEIDAVYIPLPNSLHREWTIRCAEQGKHVLCEKPMGLNTAECRDMIAACAAHRVVLMEAFMYRYSDRTRQVLDVVRSGALGEIKFISSTFRFLLANPASIKMKPELGGGSLYDVGCYPVNFTGMITDAIAGAEPGKAPGPQTMAVECVNEGGVDMIFSAVVKYSSGLIASLNSGLNAHKRIHSEIVGTKAALEVPDTFFGNPGVITLVREEKRTEIPIAESDRYRLEVEDFADAILRNRPPLFSLNETLRNMEVIDRLFAASRKNSDL